MRLSLIVPLLLLLLFPVTAQMKYEQVYISGPELTVSELWRQVQERSPYVIHNGIADPEPRKLKAHGLCSFDDLFQWTREYYLYHYKKNIDIAVTDYNISFSELMPEAAETQEPVVPNPPRPEALEEPEVDAPKAEVPPEDPPAAPSTLALASDELEAPGRLPDPLIAPSTSASAVPTMPADEPAAVVVPEKFSMLPDLEDEGGTEVAPARTSPRLKRKGR